MDAVGLAELHATLGIPADYAATRSLVFQPEADETALVAIETGMAANARVIRLLPSAAKAWNSMSQAAQSAGVKLLPVSGFRSIARQAEIIRNKRATGEPLPEILRLIAAPGYSEHHTGRALDLAEPDSRPLEECFAHTTAFAWLEERASAYGFHLSYPRNNPSGIAFEPWHWCWQA